jgi:hypothetical protein
VSLEQNTRSTPSNEPPRPSPPKHCRRSTMACPCARNMCFSAMQSGPESTLTIPSKQLATTVKKRHLAPMLVRNPIFQGTFWTGPMLTKNKRTDSGHDSCQAQKRRRSIFSPPLRAAHLVRAGCCTSVPCGPKHPSKKNLRGAIFFHEKQKKSAAETAAPVRIAQMRRIRASDSRSIQIPNFCFSRSLTACGLAFPPVCFIT